VTDKAVPPDRVSAERAGHAAGSVWDASLRNALNNLERWCLLVAAPPPAKMLRPHIPALAAAAATLVVVVITMFDCDVRASAWALDEPQWFRDLFEKITDFGLSGWFLIPSGFVVLCLAALNSPLLRRMTQGVLSALAARFGFLFLAVGVPGLFVTIVKRMIGRARPYVGAFDHPFDYKPFIWRPEYSSLPSGHATTAVAAAIAIGALWPRMRPAMWIYAFAIMASRVFVLAHHPSDVIAGALTGAVGAFLLRRWFAARRLVFCPRNLSAYPGPSLRRIKAALHEALSRSPPQAELPSR
jgi:undecaprenyl-diphosphatase